MWITVRVIVIDGSIDLVITIMGITKWLRIDIIIGMLWYRNKSLITIYRNYFYI